MVRVLILVDEDITELALVIIAHVLKLLQNLHGQQDDVVKVHGVGCLQPRLVLLVQLRDPFETVVVARVLGKGLRRGHLILGLGDHAENGARREGLFVQIPIAQDLLDHALGIRRVVDRKAAVVADALDLPAQDAAAGRMEGHCPDVVGLRPQHGGQTFFQLIGCFVCECNGDDGPRRRRMQRAQLVRRRAVFLVRLGKLAFQKTDVLLRDRPRQLVRAGRAAEADEICNAVDEDGRLAAAGAGQQQQRPLRREDGLQLHGVHAGKLSDDVFFSCGQKPLFKALCHCLLLIKMICFYSTSFFPGNKEPVFRRRKNRQFHRSGILYSFFPRGLL